MGFDHLPLVLFTGFVLGAYAFYVELRIIEARRLGSRYTALCDFSYFSCTKVFSSEYGHLSSLVGLPPVSNAVAGMFTYAFALVLHAFLLPNLASATTVARRLRQRQQASSEASSLSASPVIHNHINGSPSVLQSSLYGGGAVATVSIFNLIRKQISSIGPLTDPRGAVLVLLFLIALGCIGLSAILFYVLTVKLKDLCVVCISMYIVNIVFFLTTKSRLRTHVIRVSEAVSLKED